MRNLAFNRADIASKAVNNRGGTSTISPVGDFVGGNEGYYLNASIGDVVLQKRWDWNASLGYRYIELDAVVDAFNDSDFGLGGTNLEGLHRRRQSGAEPEGLGAAALLAPTSSPARRSTPTSSSSISTRSSDPCATSHLSD